MQWDLCFEMRARFRTHQWWKACGSIIHFPLVATVAFSCLNASLILDPGLLAVVYIWGRNYAVCSGLFMKVSAPENGEKAYFSSQWGGVDLQSITGLGICPRITPEELERAGVYLCCGPAVPLFPMCETPPSLLSAGGYRPAIWIVEVASPRRPRLKPSSAGSFFQLPYPNPL